MEVKENIVRIRIEELGGIERHLETFFVDGEFKEVTEKIKKIFEAVAEFLQPNK